MSNSETLHSLVSLFQDQRDVTHSLWVMYAVTTFTAAAFSFKNGATRPLSFFVVAGFVAFTFGHGVLVWQSIESTGALSTAILELSATIENSPSVGAAKKIAMTANSPWFSVGAHVTIDICVCVLIIFGRDMSKTTP